MKTSHTYNLYPDNANIQSLSKNITTYNYNGTAKSSQIFQDEATRVDHLYISEAISNSNWEEQRYTKIYQQEPTENLFLETRQVEYLTEEEKKKRYNKEEDEIFCGRFPHLKYCGCKYPCSVILKFIKPIEVSELILAGSIECAYKTKDLIQSKISHVLNVSCTDYNKRKYFKYLDIFINDNHTENAIKFFKLTNRFIETAINKGEKILIHSLHGKSRCWVFLMAFLIGKLRMKYVHAYEYVKEKFPSANPNENFLTQLKHYDLEMNVI